jgi:hypothetical protein
MTTHVTCVGVWELCGQTTFLGIYSLHGWESLRDELLKEKENIHFDL